MRALPPGHRLVLLCTLASFLICLAASLCAFGGINMRFGFSTSPRFQSCASNSRVSPGTRNDEIQVSFRHVPWHCALAAVPSFEGFACALPVPWPNRP